MLLEARNLGFRFKGAPWLLRGIDLAVQSGEVVGLIGPSGAGKTTLGRILSGYRPPAEGQALLDGRPLPQAGYHPVQLVFQHPETSVHPLWRMKKVLSEGVEPDPQVIEALGIQPAWLNRWPNELSGGELQRFCVARVLNHCTAFIIADEMTTMLDAITQAQLWQVVLEFVRQRGVGVLAISHERSLLERVCDRLVMFEKLNRSVR